jgi:hypothetical protein
MSDRVHTLGVMSAIIAAKVMQNPITAVMQPANIANCAKLAHQLLTAVEEVEAASRKSPG